MSRLTRIELTLAATAVTFLLAASAASASTYTVNTQADGDDASAGDDICETVAENGLCTLRAAVKEASFHPGADTVSVPGGNYDVSGLGALTVASGTDLTTVVGVGQRGPGATVIDGADAVRVLDIASGAAMLRDLRIEDGFLSGCCGAAGINTGNNVSLTLERVTVADNVSTGDSEGAGAGISMISGGSLSITDSTVSGNQNQQTGGSSTAAGGIQLVNAALSMVRSTVSGNSATAPGKSGGGIGISATLGTLTIDIANSTLSGNAAGSGSSFGGALRLLASGAGAGSSLNLYNVTVAGNTAGTGAGISVVESTVNVNNTILAGNTSGGFEANCSFTNATVNAKSTIDGADGCGFGTSNGNQQNVTAAMLNLGPLADNGGPTETRALGGGSAAIDAGDAAACAAAPVSGLDQRGFVRNVGPCDIGSFEAGASAPSPPPSGGAGPAASAPATAAADPCPALRAKLKKAKSKKKKRKLRRKLRRLDC